MDRTDSIVELVINLEAAVETADGAWMGDALQRLARRVGRDAAQALGEALIAEVCNCQPAPLRLPLMRVNAA